MCYICYVLVASPPSDVTAIQVGPTSINVSWTPPTPLGDTTGFIIYYTITDSSRSGSVNVTDGSTNEHTLTNLQNGDTYKISMIATSQHFSSNTVDGNSVMLYPGMNCMTIHSTIVHLDLHICIILNKKYMDSVLLLYICTQLKVDGVSIFMYVCAIFLNVFTLPDSPSIAFPLALDSPTISMNPSTTSTSITISWSISSDTVVDSYEVMWSSVQCPNDRDEDNHTITDGSTSYTIDNLRGGTSYNITVIATNTAGSSNDTTTAKTMEGGDIHIDHYENLLKLSGALDNIVLKDLILNLFPGCISGKRDSVYKCETSIIQNFYYLQLHLLLLLLSI